MSLHAVNLLLTTDVSYYFNKTRKRQLTNSTTTELNNKERDLKNENIILNYPNANGKIYQLSAVTENWTFSATGDIYVYFYTRPSETQKHKLTCIYPVN